MIKAIFIAPIGKTKGIKTEKLDIDPWGQWWRFENKDKLLHRLEWSNTMSNWKWPLCIFLDNGFNSSVEYENIIDDTDMMKVLGLEQLSVFFLIYAIQIIIVAIVVFIVELNSYRWTMTRNQEEEIERD